MNLADLTAVLTVIIFVIGAPASANGAGAPWWGTIGLVPLGAAIGLGTAYLAGRIMYRFLGIKSPSNEKNEGNLLLYILFPFFSLGVCIAAAVGLGNLTAFTLK